MDTRTSPGRRKTRLEVVVTDGRGRRFRAPGLAAWLARATPARARGLVTVAVISDAAMRRLNRAYRGVDRATDVLSFGGDAGRGAPGAGEPQALLGDVAIARGVAVRQARQQGHSLRIELRILALHGVLHLLGYDHEADQGQMRRLEERLRRRAGLPHGLVARTSGRPTRQ